MSLSLNGGCCLNKSLLILPGHRQRWGISSPSMQLIRRRLYVRRSCRGILPMVPLQLLLRIARNSCGVKAISRTSLHNLSYSSMYALCFANAVKLTFTVSYVLNYYIIRRQRSFCTGNCIRYSQYSLKMSS